MKLIPTNQHTHKQRIWNWLSRLARIFLLVIVLGLVPHLTPEVAAHGDYFDVRINTGGPAQTVNGVEWLGCVSQSNCNNYVSGGFSYTKLPLIGVAPVVSPANQFIYQSEWTGGSTTGIPAGEVAFTFNVPMPNGDYLVRLHFAEVVQTSAGTRTFDVKIEGSTVLSHFDVYQQADGMHKGIVREFEPRLIDGIMTIEFIRRVNNAKISGIEIIHKDADAPPPTEQPIAPAATGDNFSVRINTGGSAQNVNGTDWIGCTGTGSCSNYVTGGFAYTPNPPATITPVVSPANQTIYQSEWTGGSTTGVPDGGVAYTFSVPVPNGNYLIRLHFAELNQTSSGKRVFDVRLEGSTVLSNFDIFAQAGGMHKGIVREFTPQVTDGVVTIEFIRRVNNAKISGIEIVSLDATPPPSTPQALFVVGNTTLSGSDAKIKTRLENLGFTVTVIQDTSATTASSNNQNLVVISSSVSSGNVNTKFTNAAVPVINWEAFLHDDLNMTSTTLGTTGFNQTQLTIVNSGHPLAAGLSGTVTTNTIQTEFAWGQPSSSATIIAHPAGQSTRPAIFGYTQGSSMVGLTAPARRVGFFFGNNTPDSLTTAGWQLFDAAVSWAAQTTSTPPDPSPTPPPDPSPTPPPDPSPPPPPSNDYFDVRINTGGPAQTVNGISWIGCTGTGTCSNYVTGGFAYTPNPPATITPVVSPANQTIYQSEWSGGSTTGIPDGGVAFAFEVPIINGNYLIRLHFAELNQTSSGKRVFDVRLEGSTVLSNFDIFAQAGGINKGIVREFTRTITDSRVNIEFIRRVNNAKISGIEIISLNNPASQQALFVVGNTTLSSSDAKIKTRLENLGFTVTVIQDTSATTASSNNQNLVVISSSVSSGNVNTKFTNAAVPVINWEAFLHDDLKMTNTTLGTTGFNQTQLTIVNSGHPLAAGLSGTVTTNTIQTEFAWGQPSSSATIIAHPVGQSTRPAIFGYTQGSSMVGLTAPARRVGFFLGNNTPDSLTTAGWQLFDAAVSWAAQITPPPPPASSTITWTQKAANPVSRIESLGIIANGRLYAFGGYTTFPAATTRSDYYDPATNTWTQIADMPEAITHAQAATDDSKIYFVGGFLGAYPSPSIPRVWIYTIATNSWSQGPSLPQAVGAGATAIVGRNLYYFGGTIRTTTPSAFNDQAESYVLNLDTLSGWQPLPPIPTKRNHMAAVTYNNKIYVFGGQIGSDEGSGNSDTVEMYDPVNNLWVPKANMPVKKGHIAAFLHNGYIYVVGGTQNDGVYGAASDTVLRYNPATNTWATMTPLPSPRKQPVAGVINGKIYVSTGQNGSASSNVTWEGTIAP